VSGQVFVRFVSFYHLSIRFLEMFRQCGICCFDSVVSFVSTVWYLLFRQCGICCFDSVVSFVSIVWYLVFRRCGICCFDSVVYFVSTVWYLLFRQCGIFCFDSVVSFVSTVWYLLFFLACVVFIFDFCFLYFKFSSLIVDFSVTICIWVMRIKFIHSFKLF